VTDKTNAGSEVAEGEYSIREAEVCRGGSSARGGGGRVGTDILIMGEEVVRIEDTAGLVPEEMGFDWGRKG
jgi:hypothetical protein